MVNMYRYQPLSDPRAIRLIMLQKSPDDNASLSCAIVETTLDKPANYYALSYTWGTEAPSEAMSIFPAGDSTTAGTSAQVIPLTPNCAGALKVLRKRLGVTDTGVWVDAVCINQSDVAEKNVQVTMMADIYSLAKCVVVWVGQQWAPKNTRSLMFLSNKWLGRIKKRAACPRKWKNLWRWTRKFICGIASTVCGDKKMLQCLAEAPYWTRVWTLQEIAHSHAKLLCANDHVIDLKSVFDSIGFVGTCRIDRPGFKYHEVFFRSSQDPQTERPHVWSKELHLYYISWFISIKASDPRDKIYATRSQFARTFGKITVDYNRSIPSVFADATKQIICEGSDYAPSMLVLANASRSTKLRDLPSWAVDWASEDITTRFWEVGAPHAVFKASRESQPRHHFSEDLKRMVLTGTIVGRVQQRHVGPQLSQHFRPKGKDPEEDMTKNPDTTKAVYEELLSWASDLQAAAAGDTRNIEPAAAVQNSTLHSFSNLLYLMSHKKSQKAFQWTPRNSLPKIIKYIASKSWTCQFFCLYLGTGRMFLTTDGRCGCGPWGLEPGELICVFSGLQFPFAVRPQGSDYILVGAAILDGVMDGEMWPEDESKLSEWEFV